MDAVYDGSATMHGVRLIAWNDQHLPVLPCGIDITLTLFDVTADSATIRRVELCDVTDLQIASSKCPVTG